MRGLVHCCLPRQKKTNKAFGQAEIQSQVVTEDAFEDTY